MACGGSVASYPPHPHWHPTLGKFVYSLGDCSLHRLPMTYEKLGFRNVAPKMRPSRLLWGEEGEEAR